MLAGPGLGDDTGLSHLPRQKRLAENVVDLVRTGVVEIFTLEEDPGTADVSTQSGGLIQRRGSPGVMGLQGIEFVEEPLVGSGLLIGRGDLFDDGHQSLRDIPAAEDPEVAARVRIVDRGLGDGRTGAGQVGRGGISHIGTRRSDSANRFRA